MGALGEELIVTEIVFLEGSLVADALHSVSNVDSRMPKETFVSDSSCGNGPLETEMHVNVNNLLRSCTTNMCT